MAINELGLTERTRALMENPSHVRANPENVYSALISTDPVDAVFRKCQSKAIVRERQKEAREIIAYEKGKSYGKRKVKSR